MLFLTLQYYNMYIFQFLFVLFIKIYYKKKLKYIHHKCQIKFMQLLKLTI